MNIILEKQVCMERGRRWRGVVDFLNIFFKSSTILKVSAEMFVVAQTIFQGCTGYPAFFISGRISGFICRISGFICRISGFICRISGFICRISGLTVEQIMRTSNELISFQNLFTKYKIRVKQRSELLVGFVENKKFLYFFLNSIFTIQLDIRYPAKPDIRYPAA